MSKTINVLKILYERRERKHLDLIPILSSLLCDDVAVIIITYLESVLTIKEAIEIRNMISDVFVNFRLTLALREVDSAIHLTSLMATTPDILLESGVEFGGVMDIFNKLKRSKNPNKIMLHFKQLKAFMKKLNLPFAQLACRNELDIFFPDIIDTHKPYIIKIFTKYDNSGELDEFLLESGDPLILKLLDDTITINELRQSIDTKNFKGLRVLCREHSYDESIRFSLSITC